MLRDELKSQWNTEKHFQDAWIEGGATKSLVKTGGTAYNKDEVSQEILDIRCAPIFPEIKHFVASLNTVTRKIR